MSFRIGLIEPPARWLLLPVVAAMLCGVPAFAQSNADPNKDTSVERLLRRIDELEASQKQMQAKLDSLTASGVAAPAAAPAVSAADAAIVAAAIAADTSEDTGHVHALGPVKFQGFSDFDFGRPWFEKLPNGRLHGTSNSFNIGDFDLFTNTRISDHWSLLGEFLVTSDFSNGFGAEIDRLMLTYKANKYLQVSFGKFNTAVGFYPNEFHRAHFFQTAISRPIMFADEDNGGILPVHSVGVTSTGLIPSGKLGLHWVAEVANGRSLDTFEAPIQNFVDQNNGKAVNFALYARPEWLPGFEVGGSIYRDMLHPPDAPSIGQNIYAAHLVYVSPKLEILNEAAIIRHAIHNGRIFHSLTSYTQISREFGKTRPYFRYDYQNVPAGEPIFAELTRRNGPSIGVAQRFTNYLVGKLQYGRLSERNVPTTYAITAQFALAF